MAENVISSGFNDSHFEFRVNQESQAFVSVIIGVLVVKNTGVDTKISSLSILEAESVISLTPM